MATSWLRTFVRRAFKRPPAKRSLSGDSPIKAAHAHPGLSHGTADAPTLADIAQAAEMVELALQAYVPAQKRRAIATMLRNAAEHAEYEGRTGTEAVLIILHGALSNVRRR